MIADFLHSFYTMPMNIFIGGVPTVVHVRWYRAPAGARYLPFPSTIFSHVWDNNPGESITGEIGEVGSPRTWNVGDNPGYQGRCWRGDPAWFASGMLPPLASIAPSPCLCQIPPAVGSGGLVLGGSAVALTAVCQQRHGFSTAPLVDVFDGFGPRPYPFSRTIGVLKVWTASPIQATSQVGVAYNPASGSCIQVGHAYETIQFPNFHFLPSAAIRYLFNSFYARWDYNNDGALLLDVFT